MSLRISLAVVMMLILGISCKKSQDFMNATLVGKWKLSEKYYGYYNGGDFKWHSYPYYQDVVFKQNGDYEENKNDGVFSRKCVGSYYVQTPTFISINSSCNTSLIDYNITEQTSTTLIIDFQVHEGIIRYKYIAIP